MGSKILNFDISLGFHKNEYSFGYEDFVDIYIFFFFFWGGGVGGGVIIKLCYIWGSSLCILGSFLKVKVQNRGYFLCC